MDKRLIAILSTVFLDAMGIALTLPALPDLLRSVGHTQALGWRFGAFIGLYGLMQFLAAPLLGAWSDRLGRRPILMLALAGAAIDYLFMAFAPTLTLLFVGRAIAGLTAGSMAVATAYITDISPEGERARHFGQLSAAIGVGFIAGPAIGGLLAGTWLRLPFVLAALLNAANLLFVMAVLRDVPRGGAEPTPLNPFAPLRWALGFPGLLPLIGVFLILVLVSQVGGTIWVIYGEDRFGWTPFVTGLSLAGFGAFHAVAQGFIAGPVTDRFGERRAILLGIAADAGAYVVMAFAAAGWIAFALLPLFCLGGVGQPALQSMLSREVADEHQGRLMGMLTGLASLVSVAAPIAISTLYFATRTIVPGLAWLVGAALYLLCLPLIVRARPRTQP